MRQNSAAYRTKCDFARALKQLMRKKPFAKITVSELIQTCGVNRNTFYYHFHSVYDLLKWVFQEEAIQFVAKFDLLSDSYQAIYFVMDYVEENEYMIHCAYDAIGRAEMKQFFAADFSKIVDKLIGDAEQKEHRRLDPAFRSFLVQFYTEAIAGMLLEWINRGPDRDRERTAQFLHETIRMSLRTAILERGTEMAEEAEAESQGGSQ